MRILRQWGMAFAGLTVLVVDFYLALLGA